MWNELRTSVRFPLHLPVVLLAGGNQIDAVTVNISTGGVLLRLHDQIDAETTLEFLLELPKEFTYDESSAAVHCVGRVIRSFEQDGFYFVAVVIDEYRFQ
jgi:hypothetical protein